MAIVYGRIAIITGFISETIWEKINWIESKKVFFISVINLFLSMSYVTIHSFKKKTSECVSTYKQPSKFDNYQHIKLSRSRSICISNMMIQWRHLNWFATHTKKKLIKNYTKSGTHGLIEAHLVKYTNKLGRKICCCCCRLVVFFFLYNILC